MSSAISPKGWPPGQSGNPTGRPRLTEPQRYARELRGQYQPRVVEFLVNAMEDDSHPIGDRITCAKALLEAQPSETKLTLEVSPVDRLSDDDLVALAMGALPAMPAGDDK